MSKKIRRFVVGDLHINHKSIIELEDRPENFSELFYENWSKIVSHNDYVIVLGDIAFKKLSGVMSIIQTLPGKKILVRGNHDMQKTNNWWMTNGFDFSCDSFTWNQILFTHEPVHIPNNATRNVHGHLHAKYSHHSKEYEYVITCNHFLYSPIEHNYSPVLLETLLENN